MLEAINAVIVAYPVPVALTALAVGILGGLAYQILND